MPQILATIGGEWVGHCYELGWEEIWGKGWEGPKPVSGLVPLGEGSIPNDVLSRKTLEGFWAPLMQYPGYDISSATDFLLVPNGPV